MWSKAKRARSWLVPAVALLMLATVVAPVDVWHRPVDEAVYNGFDPNLITIEPQGNSAREGVVLASADSITLTALQGSQPMVHLLTSQLDFRVTLQIRVLENPPNTVPLQVMIWSPRKEVGYYLTFSSHPRNLVTATVIAGDSARTENLGTYLLGQAYHLEMSVDRRTGVIKSRLTADIASPAGNNMVLLTGSPSETGYTELHSTYVPVEPGEEYLFGGVIKLASYSNDDYKLVIDWLDKNGNNLGWSNDWQPAGSFKEWTSVEFAAKTPMEAAYARMVLSAGNGRTKLLFTDLFLKKSNSPELNLLLNGDFKRAFQEWMIVGDLNPFNEPRIIVPSQSIMESSIRTKDAPDLFLKLPIAFTVSASSQRGNASVVLGRYSLALPAQRWMAMRIDDVKATGLVVGLLVSGFLVSLVSGVAWLGPRINLRAILLLRDYFASRSRRLAEARKLSLIMVMGVAVLLYFVLNFLLFDLGNHPYDLTGSKVWAYVSTRYGIEDVYFLPSTVPISKAWGGVPYAEAIFPYGPVMTYFSALVGWVYQLFVSNPGGLRMDTEELEMIIKTFNVLFGLLDGILIYKILRGMEVKPMLSLLGAGLFVLNPATWFVMSIWGGTHTLSIVFLLASIRLAQLREQLWAWLALAAVSLTRPQLLVPALFLGLIYLRMFSLRENLRAISWSIIIVFLALAPLSLGISPSLPVDSLVQGTVLQNPSAPGVGAYYYVSYDGYNIWPLFTGFWGGQSGKDRMWYSAYESLIGGFTYIAVSNIVFLGVLLAIVCLLVLRLFARRSGVILVEDYVMFASLGLLALLVLRTGVSPHHFLLVLPLIILSRKSVSSIPYYLSIAVLTITTLVPTYGGLGFAISYPTYWNWGLYYANNPYTNFFMNLYTSDFFITMGSLSNVMVLVWLTWEAVLPPSRSRKAP